MTLFKQGRTLPVIWLAAPAVGWTLVFAIAPVVMLLVYGFMTSSFFKVQFPLTLVNYERILTNKLTWKLVTNAAIVGVATSVISVAIGLVVALWLRYTESKLKGLVIFLVTVSMFASYLVRIYAWRSILGEKGLLNSLLTQYGLIDQPITVFLFNKISIVLAMVHIALPYVILVLLASLRPLERHYIEAAADLGAGGFQRVVKVILPLMAVPMASAFLFVFILSSSDFVTPQFLGGPGDSMVGVLVANNFISIGNWGAGAALSGLLLVGYGLSYAIITLGLRLAGRKEVKWGS
jgi:spermidine/putrescine transport system permease protein